MESRAALFFRLVAVFGSSAFAGMWSVGVGLVRCFGVRGCVRRRLHGCRRRQRIEQPRRLAREDGNPLRGRLQPAGEILPNALGVSLEARAGVRSRRYGSTY